MNDSPVPAELLAIVEVDKSDRVVCQAPGCGHAVYKRIHVVRQGGHASVYGSDCFGRLFAGLIPDAGPRYGSAEGRLLTSEERAMLAENTERLLAQFEMERTNALEQQRLRREQQELLERAAAERVREAKREAELRRPRPLRRKSRQWNQRQSASFAPSIKLTRMRPVGVAWCWQRRGSCWVADVRLGHCQKTVAVIGDSAREYRC
jgi:hypothetical protein